MQEQRQTALAANQETVGLTSSATPTVPTDISKIVQTAHFVMVFALLVVIQPSIVVFAHLLDFSLELHA